MNIQLADVTLHIDQTLDRSARAKIEDALRMIDGVVSGIPPHRAGRIE
jgi:hypothetical protein